MRKSQLRYTSLGVAFVLAMAVLVGRLFDLQFVKGEQYLQKEQSFSRKNIRITGSRGKILDRNGLPLAYNETSFSVQFMRDPALNNTKGRAQYTEAIIKTINIIEKNGGKFLSTFAIHRLDDGTYEFQWPGVDKDTDPKTYQSRIEKWKSDNCKSIVKKTDTPEQLIQHMREYYSVPEDASYEEVYKILSVWQEVNAIYYSSYLPVTLAQNVDQNTVAEIEIRGNELTGMRISQSETRVYPNKSMAAHIIGYMGRMLDEPTIKTMEGLGYTSDDLVGVSGIEAYADTELSGNTTDRTGVRVVEVDNLGKVIRDIPEESKAAKPGNNVMLTIDSGMQKKLEAALAENIAQINSAQQAQYLSNQEHYDDAVKNRGGLQIQYAKVGAAVVMDVQTGEILAMASHPSYDPNLFTGGLSQTDFEKYFTAPGTNNPLFNNAISSRGTPGSIFKMCTGLAGLMENQLSLTETIDDKGYFNDFMGNTGLKGPSCWAAKMPSVLAQHQHQTIVEGLKNSCNYFFYTVSKRLGVDRLNKWADLLGLTSKTGVQIPGEVAGQMSNQKALYSPGNMSGVAAMVRNQIIGYMKEACSKAGLHYEDDKYNDVAIELMNLVNEDLSGLGPDIRAILMNEMKLKASDMARYSDKSENSLSTDISASLTQIMWSLNPNFTVEAGIGQSVTLLTPIGVARYVSTLVNGGNVYDAQLVKTIISPNTDRRDMAPKLVRNIGAKQEYLNALMKGMQEVVSAEEGGTAGDYFKNFDYLSQIGGKTGSAQVNETIDLENNSWFVAFAPYQASEDPTADPVMKPEIAVVVYIPNGWKGAMSSYTAKEIIQYYMDGKNISKEQQVMPQANTLVR